MRCALKVCQTHPKALTVGNLPLFRREPTKRTRSIFWLENLAKKQESAFYQLHRRALSLIRSELSFMRRCKMPSRFTMASRLFIEPLTIVRPSENISMHEIGFPVLSRLRISAIGRLFDFTPKLLSQSAESIQFTAWRVWAWWLV